MKKKILLLLLLIFCSCEIRYEGDTKLVIKGKVIDYNNLPLSNKEIKLFVTTEDAGSFIYYIPSETNFVGRALTDSNGNYTMVIPQPINFNQIIVQTNAENNNLNEKQFINIKLYNFINYKLNLPTTKLYNKTDLTLLNVFPNQINQNIELIDFDYTGEIPNEIEAINPLNNNDFIENSIKVKKNQTLVINYTVRNIDTSITSVLQQNVVIDGSPQINFTLNY